MKKLLILTLLFLYSNHIKAASGIEEIGNYVQVIIPAYAFGLSMNEESNEGATQFLYDFATMQTSVLLLKKFIKEDRPDHSDKKSFPSGHTAAAFTGATFIHKRYGLKQAIIPYLLAGFVGYSRIEAKKHHTHDVFAGIGLATLSTYLFVNERSKVKLNSNENGDVKLENKTKF